MLRATPVYESRPLKRPLVDPGALTREILDIKSTIAEAARRMKVSRPRQLGAPTDPH